MIRIFFKILFLFSSSIHTRFIFIVRIKSLLLRLIYIGVYFLRLFIFLNRFFYINFKEKLFRLIFLRFLIGLPPFPFFLLK